MVPEQLIGELEVPLRHHLAQLPLQGIGIHLASPLVALGDDHIHRVGALADALVDPRQLLLQLLDREADRAKHAKPPSLADLHHHITAMGECEDGILDPKTLANLGAHSLRPPVNTLPMQRMRSLGDAQPNRRRRATETAGAQKPGKRIIQ